MAKGKYERWLKEENLILLNGWSRDGLSEEQIAHNMGISRSTLNEWRAKYPPIAEAFSKGREVVDYEVENALLKSALGHVQKVKKAIKVKTEKQLKDKGKIVEEHIEYVDEEVYIPPSNIAQIFWLKNRMSDKWKDRVAEKQEESEVLVKAKEILGGVESVID